jgi:DNA polymerase III sliding clamp (beta) subunit (PCNA family)
MQKMDLRAAAKIDAKPKASKTTKKAKTNKTAAPQVRMSTSRLSAPANTKFTRPSEPCATLTAQDVKKFMPAVAAITPRRTTIPMLENCRIEAGVRGINIETTCIDINAKIRTSGKALRALCVNARMLMNIATSSDLEENIEINHAGDKGRIKAGTFEVSSIICEPLDFPIPLDFAVTASITCKSRDLTSALQDAAQAMSQEETRPQLQGVYLEAADGALLTTATNGHWLVQRQINVETTGVIATILPAQAVKLIVNLAKKITPDGAVELEYGDSRIRAIGSSEDGVEWEIVARLEEQFKFPPYRNLEEKLTTRAVVSSIEVDCLKISRAVKRMALTMPKEIARLAPSVRMDVANNEIKMKVMSHAVAAADRCPALTVGDTEIAMNTSIIARIADMCETSMTMKVRAPDEAIMISSRSKPDLKIILMPMRV